MSDSLARFDSVRVAERKTWLDASSTSPKGKIKLSATVKFSTESVNQPVWSVHIMRNVGSPDCLYNPPPRSMLRVREEARGLLDP